MRFVSVILLTVLFFSMALASNASENAVVDTAYVSGNISSNTTWHSYLKVVYVTGNLTVDDGVTLTIEQGVPVKFTGNYYLLVNGRVLAQGTVGDTIRFMRDDTTGFSANDTTGGWRGIRFDGTSSSNDSSIFEYCLIEHGKLYNGASGWDNMGGGMFIKEFSKVRVENCVIRNNKVYSYGGGMRIHKADIRVINTKIINNRSNNNGGGLYVYESDHLRLIGCLIADNYSNQYGGGVFSNLGDFTITNCTFANNEAGQDGHGLYTAGSSCNPEFTNCIIWGDSDPQIYLPTDDHDPSFRYCDIDGGQSGFDGNGAGANYSGLYENNIDQDPEFYGSGDDPYSLQATSPCLNEGAPDTSGLNLPDYDIIGNPRINEAQVDMGSYESPVAAGMERRRPVAASFALQQNYPNPFNPTTAIGYQLTQTRYVELKVYNTLGQKVVSLVNKKQSAGNHTVTFDAHGLSSGVYYYRLYLDNTFSGMRKMVLIH